MPQLVKFPIGALTLVAAATVSAAGPCGIEQVDMDESSITIRFVRFSSSPYSIELTSPDGKRDYSDGGWVPVAIVGGEVWYESEKTPGVLMRGQLRYPKSYALVLFEHHYGCKASLMAEGKTFHIESPNQVMDLNLGTPKQKQPQ
ncbi:hypothetical protein [Caenimonas koreensis]|uniref:Uncharacterized protein n=1 Tax=Caenimonas koreensis DSM 17982 TaxID=1121255 RepID=A0A844BGB1_9BURK|nr:hypothetical protein [Caenimonas koreensis]MRD49501.1 hypothetical protein [Caenimonas koreensis DSM 17982]